MYCIFLFYYLRSSVSLTSISFLWISTFFLFSGHHFCHSLLTTVSPQTPFPHTLNHMKIFLPISFWPSSQKNKQYYTAKIIFPNFLFTHWFSLHSQFPCIWLPGGCFVNSSLFSSKAFSSWEDRCFWHFFLYHYYCCTSQGGIVPGWPSRHKSDIECSSSHA